VPVAHACNPNHLGGRGQEAHSSKPAWANSSKDPLSKIPNTKRTGGIVQVVEALNSNPSTAEKKE
jgi:hypothetical protein